MDVALASRRRAAQGHLSGRAFALLLALVALARASAPLRAAESSSCCPQPRAQDQVWLVSSRSLGCDLEAPPDRLKYWRYDRQSSWVCASLDELLDSDNEQVVSTVFVHGNRIPECDAFTNGWKAYRALVRYADQRPLRFIIWSWPSERVCGPVNDAREKACRTNPAGYQLAWFLDRLDPDVPVSLWAHSFGARIVTGALHLLGGGELAGRRLAERAHATRQPMQVVLLVAALDNDWLLSERFHGAAMSQVAGMHLVNNCCDALLKRYHRIYGRHCPQQALGFEGLASWGVTSAQWSKISQTNACSIVGRRHTFDGYITSQTLVGRMRAHLLFQSAVDADPSAAEMAALGEAPIAADP